MYAYQEEQRELREEAQQGKAMVRVRVEAANNELYLGLSNRAALTTNRLP